MSSESETVRSDRRSFLKRAGIVAGVAGAAAAGRPGPARAEAPEPEPEGSGYRESEHVRTYYELARF